MAKGNAQPAARLNDPCTGHGCFPSRPNVQASSNVFVNGRGAHRQTDAYASHCCPGAGCHGGNLAQGSSTVFVNGLPKGRVGDPVSCGGSVASGSLNVFVGG